MTLKKNITTLFTFITLTITAALGNQVEICKYRSDKKAAINLTFDDCTPDHLTHAVPLLEKYNFKGTFYIVPGRVPKGL